MQAAVLFFQLSIAALCLMFWGRSLVVWRRRGELMSGRDHEATPIGIMDCAVTVAIWGAMQIVGFVLVPKILNVRIAEIATLEPAQILEFSGWMMLLQLVATIIPIAWFLVRHKRVTWLGQIRFLGSDLRTGLVGFLMIVPVVMLVQLIVTQFIPYSHLTLDSLKENFSASSLMWAWVAAVGVAPISEEFFFRGLVQGFLQRVFDHDESVDKWFVGGPVNTEVLAREKFESGMQRNFRFWIPIFVSSALFAAMHIGQGPAPIPLFLLAIGLGYIFRKTGSWIPCVIIHVLLNFVSLAIFSLQIAYPDAFPVEAAPAATINAPVPFLSLTVAN